MGVGGGIRADTARGSSFESQGLLDAPFVDLAHAADVFDRVSLAPEFPVRGTFHATVVGVRDHRLHPNVMHQSEPIAPRRPANLTSRIQGQYVNPESP